MNKTNRVKSLIAVLALAAGIGFATPASAATVKCDTLDQEWFVISTDFLDCLTRNLASSERSQLCASTYVRQANSYLDRYQPYGSCEIAGTVVDVSDFFLKIEESIIKTKSLYGI